MEKIELKNIYKQLVFFNNKIIVIEDQKEYNLIPDNKIKVYYEFYSLQYQGAIKSSSFDTAYNMLITVQSESYKQLNGKYQISNMNKNTIEKILKIIGDYSYIDSSFVDSKRNSNYFFNYSTAKIFPLGNLSEKVMRKLRLTTNEDWDKLSGKLYLQTNKRYFIEEFSGGLTEFSKIYKENNIERTINKKINTLIYKTLLFFLIFSIIIILLPIKYELKILLFAIEWITVPNITYSIVEKINKIFMENIFFPRKKVFQKYGVLLSIIALLLVSTQLLIWFSNIYVAIFIILSTLLLYFYYYFFNRNINYISELEKTKIQNILVKLRGRKRLLITIILVLWTLTVPVLLILWSM